MGLFTSSCKGCGKDIDWFLDAPSHNCKCCGTYMTPEEVEKSWNANYTAHLVRMIRSQMERTGEDAETVCNRLHLNPDILHR